jgi:hypothetical protein
MLQNTEVKTSQLFGEELQQVMAMEELYLLDSLKIYHQKQLDQL